MATKNAKMTESQSFLAPIIAAMADAPSDIDLEYQKTCLKAATNVGNPVASIAKDVVGLEKTTLQSSDNVVPWGRSRSPRFVSGHAGSVSGVRNSAMSARNNVFEVIDRVSSFISKAKNAGFAPPANPFVVLAQHNVNKTKPSMQESESLAADVKRYVELVLLERNGQFNIESQTEAAAQLSSVNISMDGFGSSGNAATDLLNFIPDLDSVRKQKAKDALASIDFRKRVPKVMFTAGYSPDGENHGCIVGWKKIADASGYILKRRNVFDGKEEKFTLTNNEVKELHSRFKNYVKSWVMSFYDDVGIESVYYYLDKAPSDAFFVYTVQAYQNFQESKNTFLVDTRPVNLTPAARRHVRSQIERLDPGAGDTISPYPFLAKAILGDDKLDWILAAVNIRSSVARNDLRSFTRKMSYLTAQLDFLFSVMDEGKFVVPKNPEQVATNISKAISLFGVSQVIMESLQETGVLYHFDGVDARDMNTSKSDPVTVEASSIISTIVSAVDPETMTLDLRSLATNLPVLLEGGDVRANTKLEKGSITVEKRAEEIEVPEINNTSSVLAEDPVQFVQDMDGISAGVVDLTTFEGIGKLIRTVRVYADTQASKASPKSSVRT